MKLRLLAFTALLVTGFTAQAHWYLGFGFGNTTVKADLTAQGGGNLKETTALSDFYGGYRFNKYLGLELAYLNLADVNADSLGAPPNDVSGSVDMKAFTGSVVLTYPVTKRTEIYAKGGTASWKADVRRDAVTEGVDGTDLYYGIGAAYGFTREFFGTVDFDVIDSGNPEFSTVSLGFRWDFK